MKKSPFQTRVPKVSGLSPFKDETDEVASKYQPTVDWYKKYLGSDTYSTLTGKMKEGDTSGFTGYFVDEATDSQKRYVETYPYRYEEEENTGESSITEERSAGSRGYYAGATPTDISQKGGKINIDPGLSDEAAFEVMVHELGHTDRADMTKSGFIGKQIANKNPYFIKLIDAIAEVNPEVRKHLEGGTTDDYYKLNKYIDKYIYGASVSSLVEKLGISQDLAYSASWAAQPYEVRSELMKLRYQAEKAGIHFSTGEYEEFTQEKLDKLKKEGFNNLLLNTKFKDGVEFRDEDVIWYMNNIAMEQNEDDDPNRDMHASNEGQNTPMSMRINPKTGL